MLQITPKNEEEYLFNDMFMHIKQLNILPFLKDNMWINFTIILVLILILLYQFLLLRRHRMKSEFMRTVREKRGPLSPQNLLQTLMDHIPDFVYIKDTDSRYIIASNKLARTLGKNTGEELTGKKDHDFYPSKLADKFKQNEDEIIASGICIDREIEEGRNENGNIIWVETSKFPLKDKNGRIAGIAGIGRDITELKQKETDLEQKTDELLEANTLLEERQEEILQQQEKLKVQSEKFLDEKNQLLTLINTMPDRIYIKDRKSRFIIGNVHVAKIMGAAKPGDLVGKTDFDFYDKNLASEYYKDEQELMSREETIINKEEIGLNAAGEEIIVSTTKVPVKDDEGNVIGLVGIGRDITRQKEVENALKEKSNALQEANVLLEERQEEIQQQSEELKAQSENLLKTNEELEKLSMVASKTENVIIIMDGKGNFEWVNDGFTRRYQMTMEEFIDKRGENLLQNSSFPDIGKVLDKVKQTKKSSIYIARRELSKNDILWSQTTISPVLDENGDIIKLIAIDTDITRLKKAEEQVEKQRDELKKLNTTKDKFFSIIAHDLKNPFHSIMGFSDLLTRSYDAIAEEKKKEFIKLINDSSTSAYGLLENLLNWARTQTNRIKYNPGQIDISLISKEVFQMMSVSAENKNVKLRLPDDFKEVYAYADYNMVYTVIRNLVNNALKFTESGGTVSIESKEKNGRLELGIKDTGIGMTEEEKNKLFRLDEFHTTTGTSGETGTGLGLIVCREFINIHGGDISIDSEKGKGSTFRFSLPLKNSKSTKEKIRRDA